jgi:hypothetical protein
MCKLYQNSFKKSDTLFRTLMTYVLKIYSFTFPAIIRNFYYIMKFISH